MMILAITNNAVETAPEVLHVTYLMLPEDLFAFFLNLSYLM